MTEMFGLKGPLNRRDASAASFADLFETRDAPRAADMPAMLPRPPLGNAAASSVAGVPVHPADEPLDALTEACLHGLVALTRRTVERDSVSDGGAPEASPTTHGEAAELIDRQLRGVSGI